MSDHGYRLSKLRTQALGNRLMVNSLFITIALVILGLSPILLP